MYLIKRLKKVLKNRYIAIKSQMFRRQLRKRCLVSDFTIISNSCLGGVVYHQLGKKFCSPTINLWIEMEGFFSFCKDIEPYIRCEVESIDLGCDHPTGIIKPNDIEPLILHFNHDKTFEEAKHNWDRRKERIIKDRIIVFFDASAVLKIDDLFINKWNEIPYPKICFGCLDRDDIDDYYFVDFNGHISPAKVMQYYKDGRLFLNQVDYCSMINNLFVD